MSQRNFQLLWGGQFVSNVGGQLSIVALPAAVVVLLGATPMQAGALQAVEFGIIPLLAIVAGVVIDRFPRRRMMIGANVVRCLALISLPVAFLLHHVSLAQFFLVSVIVGLASVVFDTAYAAFFPALIAREDHAEGSAKMSMGSSGAELAGSSLGGVVVTALGAPVSIAFNALTHLVSAFALARIHCNERRRSCERATPGAFAHELAAGARALLNDRVLRTIGFTSATSHFGGAIVMSVFYIFLYRQLHLSPLVLGLVFGIGNIGIGGAFFARRIAARLGMHRTLTISIALAGGANLLLPLFAPAWPIVTIVAVRLLLTLCGPVFEVNQQTIRIARVPPELMGRMSATNRTLVWGMLPIGALVGGYLGTALGVVPTMFVGGTIALAAAIWMAGCPTGSLESATLAAAKL